MYLTNQNQTLETTQLANNTQNTINLTTPTINPSYVVVNPNNNPNFIQNHNPIINTNVNPQFNPIIKPIIKNSPKIDVNVETKPPKIEIKKKRTIVPNVKLGLKPKNMICPFCEEHIVTETETSMNMKAFCTAIGTFYIGFVMMQACNNKEISCQDCEHSCPLCHNIIGTYYAM